MMGREKNMQEVKKVPMKLLDDTSIGAIAVTLPKASGVFRHYDLDFCCGGKLSLKEACAEKGIPLSEVREKLEALQEEPPRAPQNARGITSYIETRYHQDLRRRFPELIALALKVEKAHHHSPHLPEGLSTFLEAFHKEMETHMKKEEEVLFPLISAGHTSVLRIPISCMEEDHEAHGRNLRALRGLTANFTVPDGACVTWRALYKGLEELELELMEHINLENNVLFPKALGTLVP